MRLFDFGNKEIKKLTAQVNDLQSSIINRFVSLNPLLAIYPDWNVNSTIDRYLTTDEIYSIIKFLATNAAGSIPLYGYYVTADQKSFKELKRELKYNNPYKYKKLQTKALEDLPEDDPACELLENPHETMSKFEFFESVFSFILLAGEVFILKERPDDGINKGRPISLKIMFPQCVTLKITDTLPRKVIAYDYRINGQLVYENIPASEVIHIKYWNPQMSYSGSELRGLSPLKVLKKRLTRADKTMDTSVAQVQNGGVQKIVFDKSDNGAMVKENGVEVSIAGRRKDNFYKFSSNPANAGQPFFASGEMGAVDIGSQLSDMGLNDLSKIDKKGFCDAYSVSDRLFNNDATGSEVSDKGARKGMYLNALIPLVRRVKDAWVKQILPDFELGVVLEEDGEPVRIPGDGKKRYVDLDISGIPELQEDIKNTVAQYANLPIMIPNMILEELGFPTIEDDPMMDKVYVKTGYQLLEDLEPMPPLDDGN